MTHALATMALLGFGGGLTACDDGTGVTPDGTPLECQAPTADRYLPLATGNTWTYLVTEPMMVDRNKTSTVGAKEDIGGVKAGVMAFAVTTAKTSGSGDVKSWQEDTCTSVVRHREQTFDVSDILVTDQIYLPSKLRIDETTAHTTLGAMWTASYSEVETANGAMTSVSKDETWSVQAIDESVTVPAGTFTALKISKTTSGAAVKTYWFAKGVGKVKETGEQTEELTSYTVQ